MKKELVKEQSSRDLKINATSQWKEKREEKLKEKDNFLKSSNITLKEK